MGDEHKILSSNFIEAVRKSIIRYLLKRPFLVVWYGIIFLKDSLVSNPCRKECFVPKHILDNLSTSLESTTVFFLSSIARGEIDKGVERCALGKGVIQEGLQKFYLDVYPYASWAHNFFDLLYIELEKIAESKKIGKYWRLKKEGTILYLHTIPLKTNELYKIIEHKKAVPVRIGSSKNDSN